MWGRGDNEQELKEAVGRCVRDGDAAQNGVCVCSSGGSHCYDFVIYLYFIFYMCV